MNSNNGHDIIEISDDSGDVLFTNASSSGGASKKRMRHATSSDSDNSSSNSSAQSDEVQWIEDESESEPELECDLWDKDCHVSEIKCNSKLIHGYHLMPTCAPEPESPLKQQKISAQLNNEYMNEEFINTLKKNFKSGTKMSEKSCDIIVEPWKVLILNCLLQESSILEQVRQEFNDLHWNKRTMDLYEFFQSNDLKHCNSKNINVVYNFIKSDLKEFVASLFDIELTYVSATCSYYSDTDYLLTHDDQRGDRAVAFVLYLTDEEGWNTDWGGQLELLDTDENQQPHQVVATIVPKYNQLVLFPVSDCSYHQVGEVTTKNHARLSINGWFHTTQPLKFEAPIYKAPSFGIHSDTFITPIQLDIDLETWIDRDYLQEETVSQIQNHIEENSEMSLQMFFNPIKAKQVTNILNDPSLTWSKLGPSNRRNYEVLHVDAVTGELMNLLDLMKSDAMFGLLNSYTDLELHNMKMEVQRWKPGCYSLLNEQTSNQLDIVIYLGECQHVVGGKTQYVTLEDEVQTALISLHPKDNTLNLVYGDTARYTSLVSKHTHHHHPNQPFYTLVATYYELP